MHGPPGRCLRSESSSGPNERQTDGRDADADRDPQSGRRHDVGPATSTPRQPPASGATAMNTPSWSGALDSASGGCSTGRRAPDLLDGRPVPGGRGGSRTHMSVTRQGILNPPRLPIAPLAHRHCQQRVTSFSRPAAENRGYFPGYLGSPNVAHDPPAEATPAGVLRVVRGRCRGPGPVCLSGARTQTPHPVDPALPTFHPPRGREQDHGPGTGPGLSRDPRVGWTAAAEKLPSAGPLEPVIASPTVAGAH